MWKPGYLSGTVKWTINHKVLQLSSNLLENKTCVKRYCFHFGSSLFTNICHNSLPLIASLSFTTNHHNSLSFTIILHKFTTFDHHYQSPSFASIHLLSPLSPLFTSFTTIYYRSSLTTVHHHSPSRYHSP